MNLIQPLLNSFPNQTWNSLAGTLNETPEHTRQGLADALPMFFASLIGKGSTLAGAAGLLSMIRNNHFDVDRVTTGRDNVVTEPGTLREGGAIAQSVLGEGFGSAANAISRHAGVALGSAQSLLGLAAPLALGGIAKAAPASGFTAESLMRFLQGQRDDVLAAAPQGLPINVGRAQETVRAATAPVQRTGNRWLPWLVGLAAVVMLGLVLGQCSTQRAAITPEVQAPKVVVPQAPASNAIQLPGGVRLNALPGSIGYNLAAFLGSAQSAPRTFTFDNLNFDSGNVVLTPDSISTLDAIAASLNAYPNARVRLEGHTDSTGDRAANVGLSLARAQAVARSLTDRGVSLDRITAAGFGPDNPIASNETDAGRAQNRRLELTVTQK